MLCRSCMTLLQLLRKTQTDSERVLGCNNTFCKMFGMTRDSVLQSHVTDYIPAFLAKKHRRAMALTLNDASFNSIKKDVFLLGVHSSGYLVPLNASVVREISFTEIAQFYVRFIEPQHKTPTLYLLLDKSERIEGATSGIYFFFRETLIEIFAWFGIDISTLARAKMRISSLIPSMKDRKVADLVGNTQIVRAVLKNVKRPQGIPPYNSPFEVVSLQEIVDNECPLELTVKPLNFRETCEAYVVRLQFPKEESSGVEPKDPKVFTTFDYNPEHNAYVRNAEDLWKSTRTEYGKSMFYKDSETYNARNVRSTLILQQSQNNLYKSKREDLIQTLSEMQQNSEYSIFQEVLLYYVKETVVKLPEPIKDDTYSEVKEIIETITERTNYGNSVKLKTLPNAKEANDEMKGMELGLLACVEEETDTINRVNKSREIEKEFTEKKIQSVLLSNKETKKSVKERSSLAKLFIFFLLTLLLYVFVPLSLAVFGYFLSRVIAYTNLDVADYVSTHYKFLHESSEAYSNIELIAYLNRYLFEMKQEIGQISKSPQTQGRTLSQQCWKSGWSEVKSAQTLFWITFRLQNEN
eukprot:TRINITY_DN183_c0_g1_i2.p1 TRINITY_DN183_c0_g1~~TRINITY_DN183_c0_g1_i2.p1  ORF type:complete len:580 (-),score=22.52 TRINITY_DN183_c0_g1_i2:2395-4134(-)